MRSTVKSKIFIALLLSFIWVISYAPSASAAAENKNVLIINSYKQDYHWAEQEYEGLRQAFYAEQNVMLFIEYMDWKHYPNQKNLDHLYEYYKYKYANKKIDMIITTDDAALLFALKHRKELFSDAPIVFGGVYEGVSDVLLAGAKNVTGIYEKIDPEGTITAAKQMAPDMKAVYVVHDKKPIMTLLPAF